MPGRRAIGPFLLVFAIACARHPAAEATPVARFFSADVPLGQGTLELHLAATSTADCRSPLVLYVSGDGGWFGAAVDMFRELAAAGCPTVGFSARSFLKSQGPARRIADTEQLAGAYEQVIVAARRNLGLPPSTPVVLTGWSRGAAFAVLTALQLGRVDHVAGIVAIGLAEGEDLSAGGSDTEGDEGPSGLRASWPYEPYRQLAQLPMPAAVIQATQDDYLPASAARALFGPDTPVRRFYTVDARNHRFSGGKAAFSRSLREALEFVRLMSTP